MNTFQRKLNIVLYQIAIIAVVFVIVFFYSAASLFSQIILILNTVSNKLESICGCANHFSFFSHPYFFTSLFLLSLLIIFYLGFVLFKFIRLRKITNNFVRENLRKKRMKISKKLASIIEQIGLENKVIEIKTEKPVVFCFSFFKPKICISSGLIKKLNKKELRAVLLHEQRHLENREPLKLFFVKNTERVLFFLPGLKTLTRQYFVYSEMAADEFATNGFQNKSSLASALYKVMDLEKNLTLNKKSFAVSFFDTINERVNRLINNKYNPQDEFTSVRFAISIIFLFFIAFSFSQIKGADLVLAETHQTGSCLHKQNVTQNDCEILRKELVCEMEDRGVKKYFNECDRKLMFRKNY